MTGDLPFAGLRVLDVGSFIAGPAAATVLGDFGAEVIKVEAPGEGDPYRHLGSMGGMPVSEHNYCWTLDARNKRSLALDLTGEAGRAVLMRLVATADVLVTNFPPRTRRRLGLDWPELERITPRLVFASLSVFVERAPEVDKPGFDSTAYWARSGLMHLVRSDSESPPGRSLPGQGDHPTSMAVYGAIVTALFQRERTGRGQWVSSSLMANGAWSNACVVQAMLAGAPWQIRPPRSHAVNALANLYQCGDGRWFLLALVREERLWPRLCTALGRDDLTDDPRFATTADRKAHASLLIAELDRTLQTMPWDHWRPIFDAAGITFAEVSTLEEVVADPQMEASGAIVPLDDPAAGADRVVSSPFTLEGVAKVAAGPAPALGADGAAVLAELGYSDAEIDGLKRAGVLG